MQKFTLLIQRYAQSFYPKRFMNNAARYFVKDLNESINVDFNHFSRINSSKK